MTTRQTNKISLLIAGDQSYIGDTLARWLLQTPDLYTVDIITLKTDDWQRHDFSQYDTVFIVASIVHQHEKAQMYPLYERVNYQLAVNVAKKARDAGVTQLIFMSTMAVYGLDGAMQENCIIDLSTPLAPKTYYAGTKVKAETALTALASPEFALAIIRAPMVYGPNCPGNYNHLRTVVSRFRVFPRMQNQRSMLYIDNLCELLRLIIMQRSSGLFFPQDDEYHATNDILCGIAGASKKKLVFIPGVAWLIKFTCGKIPIMHKVYGNLVYSQEISSHFKGQYRVVPGATGVETTEALWK